ncbi:MAG: aminotransferase class III-fold pyridoxal phosphate-dependent enzyme, partial [Rhodospirillaceae bacterium]
MSQSGNAALQARREAAVPRGLSTNQPVFAARAENGEIWDVDGKRYIDFASGIAVLATGHRHPKVVAAAKEQLDSFAHVCVQVTPYEPYVRHAERLNAMMPGPGPKKTLFLNSGAEAVENAVKIARIATGRS